MIGGPSVDDIKVLKLSKATINVKMPAEVQLSALPLGGKYKIKCTLKSDPSFVQYSREIKTSEHFNTILHRIY